MTEFADRLNLLFGAFLQPGSEHGRRREEWPDAAVARLAVELSDDPEHPALTRQYLGMLRSGKRQPSLRAANVIATTFAELSRRSGSPCDSATLLGYLAGDHPAAGRTLDPDELRAALGPAGLPDMERELAFLARHGDGGSAESLDAVRSLIEQLSRQDAEPMRRRLARLLGIRGPGGSSDDDPGR